MKKITLLITMLLSITAFAQVEIVENFDSTQNFSLPDGWSQTGFFNASEANACGGSGKSATVDMQPFAIPGEATLTTPNYTSVTNATDLTISYSINVYEQSPIFPPPATQSAPLAGWGSVTLEYTIDGGANWITASTIDDSNFTYTDAQSCTEIPATNLGALAAGSDFQARFVVDVQNVSDTYSFVVSLDNVSITQEATTTPNCDVDLLSPTTDTDLDETLMWQTATGLPTGYTVSIGTTSGGTDILDNEVLTETSYPMSGLGLAYDTQYFVNIVPFNGFGDATGCTEQTFTTRSEPIEGATCSNPFEVASFPYVVANDNTGNYENNINEGPCGNFASAFIDGFDVFYTITPTTDISIDINLATISSNGAAIHVMDDCPDVATNCVGFIGDDYSSTPPYNLEINDLTLLAGNTYFVVLSSAGFDSNYTYSLVITENDCINPTFSVTPVPNCANDEFSVDVDVTYMGGASSLTLSDNFGNSDNNITSTGVVSFGPYASADVVDFTLTNNDDNTCSATDSTFFYCPPENDDCSNSITLDVNTDGTCTLVTNGSNAGASESPSDPVNCEFTGTNDVWFSFTATQTTMIVEYLNVTNLIGEFGTLQATELLEGSCGSLTSIGCYTNNYITLNNLTVGNTYYIRNSSSGTGESGQKYDICLREAPTPPANDECSNAITLNLSTDENCDNLLSGSTLGATPSPENTCNEGFTENWKDVWYTFTAPEEGIYEFSFNRVGFDPGADYFIYSGSCGALVIESQSFCFNTNPESLEMDNGETFYIMVRSGDNGPGIDFDLCVFKLPPPVSNDDCSTPIELLESTDASGNNMISGNFDNSYPSAESCDTSANTIWYSFTPTYTGEYNFNFTAGSGFPYYTVYNTDDCSQTANNFASGFTCYTTGPVASDLVAGNTYLISVFSYSDTDTFDLLAYPDPSLSVASNNLDTFEYYPNPVVNSLTVKAKSLISTVSVYNILGEKIQDFAPNDLEAEVNMSQLNDGVYFVKLTINNVQNTIKVIKE